jgi:hypothetical protein
MEPDAAKDGITVAGGFRLPGRNIEKVGSVIKEERSEIAAATGKLTSFAAN